jgi:hypothetical protein
MHAVGILIESTMLDIWLSIRRTANKEVPSGRMAKLLGYIWVLAWTTWTGPKFTWIVARGLPQGKEDVVPLIFIKWLGYRK